MQRRQISLPAEERQLLDAESARAGRSISALIQDAVHNECGQPRYTRHDLAEMAEGFGTWGVTKPDGEEWVEQLRGGSRMDVHRK